MDKIDDNIALELLHHPMVRQIVSWAGRYKTWYENLSTEDNVLIALRYFMVVGLQNKLIEKLNEPHILKTDDGIVDFNQIAKDGTADEMDPVLKHITRYNLVWELENNNDLVHKSGRMLIYIDQHGEMNHRYLDWLPDHHDYAIVYKKFVGMMTSDFCNFNRDLDRDTKLTTSPEKINSLLSRRANQEFVYVGE